MQSRLFSAVHYGGLISVLPAGIIADKFDPKLYLSIAVALITVITLISPLLANFNYYAMFVARIVLGLGDVSKVSNFFQIKNTANLSQHRCFTVILQ